MVGLAFALGGCGSAENDNEAASEPDEPAFTFTRATDRQVRELFNAELGAESGGEPRVTAAACIRGSCTVEYRAKAIALDGDREIINDQRPIWKELFSDRRFREAELIAYTTVESVGGKESNEPVLRVTCDRADNRQIDWDNVDHEGVKKICDVEPLVGGL